MNCEQCGEREAEVQYTEVEAGSKQVQWLCSGCAAQRGILVWSENGSAGAETPSTSVVPKTKATITITEVASPAAIEPRSCEVCGTGLAAIRRTGRVGCPRCYVTFEAQLEPLLQRVHGQLQHAGRRPGELNPNAERRKALVRLRRDLDQAVADEDFEAAARLRDRIRGLEEAPQHGASS